MGFRDRSDITPGARWSRCRTSNAPVQVGQMGLSREVLRRRRMGALRRLTDENTDIESNYQE